MWLGVMYAVEGDVGGCLEDNGVVFIEVEGGVVVGVEKVVEGVGEEGGEGVVTRERGGMRKRMRRRRSGRGEGVGGKGGGGEVVRTLADTHPLGREGG